MWKKTVVNADRCALGVRTAIASGRCMAALVYRVARRSRTMG